MVSSCSTYPTPNLPIPPRPTAPCSTRRHAAKCSRDVVKLGVCADALGLINLNLGKPPKVPCCTLLQGLADLEAAVCLCTVLKANVLGIQLNLPIKLSLLLNYCGKGAPSGFHCA
ncbi:14 kDa proline-rich protein DC2.15 [Dendrobium catenatum]|uniref:14 kDa proline-rich protein DC2.15 n=2 Tax=Dendrobium catenatum TaxID=906689 RepID=A0A2I0WNC8_9ASPA|nr:14 kDa proline-rich protein DC2.15 [Dendrobium catenatum]